MKGTLQGAFCLASTASAQNDPIKVGMIGLDTSHVTAFTEILNDPNHPNHVPGTRVVAGYKGGSPDMERSTSRIERFTGELEQKWQVRLFDSIPELCRQVDLVLLTSVDGRVHLEQARPVIAARLPLFVDKPLAASYRDAKEIYRLAGESSVPVFSASSVRYYADVDAVAEQERIGEIRGADVWTGALVEPGHPGLFFYGIHGVEFLYRILGTGCEEVQHYAGSDQDVVVGRWTDGRLGTLRALKSYGRGFGAALFGSRGAAPVPDRTGNYYPSMYAELLKRIVEFSRTGKSPVAPEETLEIMAFMQAAHESQRSGKPFRLSDLA
ncbi:MAG: Gfo/Idh/MocA family oxidoreductase [Acidobacteriota bacterium]|nr:MAG: Gfo/Idh/MocA family oxidoreductase [Acidobacteriota bacterium]